MIFPFEILAGAYLVLNAIAFMAFSLDKRGARKHKERASEKSLLVLSFFGPFGAFTAMRLFHHKTRKGKFLLVPFFMLLHLAMLIYLLYKPLFGNISF